MTRTHIICVVGLPRTGKDTFVELAREALEPLNVVTHAFSMIDGVREGLLAGFGIDTSAKTPADRALLVAVGDAVETHSEFKTQSLMRAVQRAAFGRSHANAKATMSYKPPTDDYWFVQVREQAVIDRIRTHFDSVRVVVVINTAASKAFADLRERGLTTATDEAAARIAAPLTVFNPYGDADVDNADAMDEYRKVVFDDFIQPVLRTDSVQPTKKPVPWWAVWMRGCW